MGKRFRYEGGNSVELDSGAILNVSLVEDILGVSQDTLLKLVDLERLVFGDGAFGEYLICSARAERGNCGLVVSREFALKSMNSELCPSCNAKMEMVFPVQAHLNYLRWIFSHGVKAVLLSDDEGGIVGFSLMFTGDLNRCFEEINYRRGYDLAKVQDAVERYLGVVLGDQQFACANRIGFHPKYQGFGLLPLILRLNASQFDGVLDLPALGDTMIHPSGKLFAPVVAAGYEPLTFSDGSCFIDQHGGVLLVIDQFRRFVENLELEDGKFLLECGHRLASARSMQLALKDSLPSPNNRFYRDAPVLRIFDHSESFQFYKSADLNPRLLRTLSDAFREVFANAFGQYLVDSSGRNLSPTDFFDLDYVPLDSLDTFNRTSGDIVENYGHLEWWHHPEVTYDILSRKLSIEGSLELLFEGSDILGFCFGYVAEFESAFRYFEEWENPYLYSGLNIGGHRDIDDVILAIKKYIPEFARETRIYVFNAVGLKPSARGKGNVLKLFSLFFARLEGFFEELPVMLETKFASKAYDIFTHAGAVPVLGALNSGDHLEEGDIVMMVGDLNVFKKSFLFSTQ